jgi:hypothetical protein
VRAYFDQHITGTIYAITVSGEIIVMETVGSLVRADYFECKLVQKFKTKYRFEGG